MSDNGQYAGFWARVAASSLDMSIIVLIALALGMAGTAGGEIVALAAGVINFFVALLYGPVLESSARQATFGKQMLGLQVTDVEGNRTSFLRALGRNLAKIISYIPLCIGFVMVAFTAKKQGLHDWFASTYVLSGRRSSTSPVVIVLVAVIGAIPVIGIIAAIAVPGLLRARQSGNEAFAIQTLRAIDAAQERHFARCGGYAADIPELTANAGLTLGAPVGADGIATVSGYAIAVSLTGADVADRGPAGCGTVAPAYLARAFPVQPGATGTRYFRLRPRQPIDFDTSEAFEAATPIQ